MGTNGQGLRDLALNLNNATHTGVQFSTTYGNVLENLHFFGTLDIGVLIHDSYVCDLNRVSLVGCTVRRFGVYVGTSNTIRVTRLHTSMTVQDAATCLYGLAVFGAGRNYTIEDCVLQGATIGIALHNSGVVSANILNPYFENTVLPLRFGDTGTSSGPVGVTVMGGVWAGPYATHPQHASRGPIIWGRHGTRFSIKGARFDETPAPATGTGPWSILCGSGLAHVNVEACSIFGTATMKDLVMRELSGNSPSVTIVGDTYGANAATELVLKNDGVFGGASHGIRVNSAGTLSTSAYTPTAITGSVAALLSSNLPAPATLLL